MIVRLAAVVSACLCLAGCVELGLVEDGTTLSVGRASRGRLVGGARLPDSGEGFATCTPWQERGNRFGTDELIDLIVGVGRRMAMTRPGPRLIVADLSAKNGGTAAIKWHRSHQSGRDVDLVYFVRDAEGTPVEGDAMRVFGRDGKAKDGSNYSIDVPRTWSLVKHLVLAREATVQHVFMFEPIAQMVLQHAIASGESEDLVARARMALKQPGDSAPHDDHVHVRIYCSERDRTAGCVDFGPMDLWAIREDERVRDGDHPTLLATLFEGAATIDLPPPTVATPLHAVGPATGAKTSAASVTAVPGDLTSLGRLLRAPIRGPL